MQLIESVYEKIAQTFIIIIRIMTTAHGYHPCNSRQRLPVKYSMPSSSSIFNRRVVPPTEIYHRCNILFCRPHGGATGGTRKRLWLGGWSGLAGHG